MYDDLQLFAIEVDATYRLDNGGRFACDEATRFFIGQTICGNLSRFRIDQPSELITELNAIVEKEPVVSDLRAGLTYLEEYKRILSKWAPVMRVKNGLGYRYPQNLQHFPDVVRVRQDNVHLAAESFRGSWRKSTIVSPVWLWRKRVSSSLYATP